MCQPLSLNVLCESFHFTDEEPLIQRGEAICPMSHSQKDRELGLKVGKAQGDWSKPLKPSVNDEVQQDDSWASLWIQLADESSMTHTRIWLLNSLLLNAPNPPTNTQVCCFLCYAGDEVLACQGP